MTSETKPQRKPDLLAEERLLYSVSYTFNKIKNTPLGSGAFGFKNTYEIASALDRLRSSNGEGWSEDDLMRLDKAIMYGLNLMPNESLGLDDYQKTYDL